MKIFITEAQAQKLKEMLGDNNFSIALALLNNKKNNIPLDNTEFAAKLLKVGYDKTVNAFSDDITKVDKRKVFNRFNKILDVCKRKEMKLRPQLEHLCSETLQEIFGIPTDEVFYSCELVDEIDPAREFHVKSNTDEEFEYDNIESIDEESIEIKKRRLLNIICIGAASYVFEKAQKVYLSKLFELDEELPHLYNKLIKLNDYLIYIDNVEITDKNHHQGGYVNVTLGTEEKKSKIEVRAMLFPILLFESIKGLMELFVSNGLPDDISQAQRVVGKADILEEEPWDMRFSTGMWQLLSNRNNIEVKTIPEFMNLLSKINAKDMQSLLNELAHHTKKGYSVIDSIINKADYSTNYASFENDLSNRNDNSIVEDAYFTSEELSSF
jgi:hypothetical protein